MTVDTQVDVASLGKATRDQPVRLGPSKEDCGRDHLGNVLADTLLRIHERADDEGVRRPASAAALPPGRSGCAARVPLPHSG